MDDEGGTCYLRTICQPTAGLINEESASCDLLQLPRRYDPKSSPERVAVGTWGRRLKQKMERTPSDIVKEAAEEDSNASVETWGPEAFARRIRTKIHNFGAPLPPWEDKRVRPTPQARGIPKSINVILLGPTGSGKSSLIYTWWRALSGCITGKEEFFAKNVHNSFLERLRVGWNAEQEQGSYRRLQASALAAGESSAPATITTGVCSGGDAETGENDRVKAGEALMRAAPRHGTVGLDAFQLQAPDPQRGSSGITVHDTKGQQFFTEEEERFAEKMLEGKVKKGSAVDKQNYKYWFMVGNFGFFSTASLATSPHVVVLVFDVTIRSFQEMLRNQHGNELCACYRKIVRRASKQGHEVFAVLTHIDAYTPEDDDDDDEEEDGEDGSGEGEGDSTGISEGERETPSEAADGSWTGDGFDREADMPGIISLWREALSQVLGDEKRAPLPTQNVFAVHNYHKGSSAQDPVRDLAALECLEGVIHAGKRYVNDRYQQQQEGCVIG